MRRKKTRQVILNVIISSVVLIPLTAMFFLNKLLSSTEILSQKHGDFLWIRHGIQNLLGYSTVGLPIFLSFLYLRKIDYLNKNYDGIMARTVKLFFEDQQAIPSTKRQEGCDTVVRTFWTKAWLLLFYCAGLQASYLTWGIVQEKVMTQVYQSEDGKIEYFGDSQFLVFTNRVLAFSISGLILSCKKGSKHHECPLYKYMYCSFTNIMSSWCQYEALKYVSFPHQVLAKAAKTIPVMLMGKLVSKTQYKYYEYVTSITLSIGMLCFMIDVGNDKKSTVTTISGVFLLVLYIGFDSFTSSWQGALFKKYCMSPIQMMCFVNLFSVLLTGTSLLQQDSFFVSLNFLIKYPTFLKDCFLLSVCSTLGQLFIFSTILEFGPLVFVIISTTRQCLSVLLSCILYNHDVHALGVFGLSFVFWSIFLRIYCGYRSEQKKSEMFKNDVCMRTEKI